MFEGNEFNRLIDRLKGALLTRAEGAQKCRVYNNATQTITTGTGTYVTYNTDLYDPVDMHSTSSNTGRITPATSGQWRISCGVTFQSSATGVRYVALIINRTTVIAEQFWPASGNDAATISTPYQFSTGDYVETYVYHTHGANLNVGELGLTGIGPRMWMSAEKIA